MKICHFTSAHKSNDIRIFHKECVSLAEANHSVYLVAVNCIEEVLDGVNIVNVSKPPSGRISRMLKTSKAVYKKALSLDADVYHLHDPELLRFALRLKRKGKHVIYDSHENVPKQIMAKAWIPKLIRKTVSKLFEQYENFVVKRIDAVVTATSSIRDRFASINNNTIDINNYPLMTEFRDVVDPSDKMNEICYVGGITKIRGLSEVVESLTLLENVKLNLAGNFSQGDSEFETQLKTSAGWNKVNELGYVNRTEVQKILQRSKVGIITIWPFPNHLESLAIKMFEYMSAGIPVVCSNFPLWQIMIEADNFGICVNPLDPREIADAVQKLIENPTLSLELGENGRKAVYEKYNWDIEKQKLITLYSQL
jgi:glycosyltransferase involved in cell wall biosynthesis